MKDPVLDKLTTDAGIVLGDLWRLLSHRPPTEERRHPRSDPPAFADGAAMPKPPAQNGLCCFHLN